LVETAPKGRQERGGEAEIKTAKNILKGWNEVNKKKGKVGRRQN